MTVLTVSVHVGPTGLIALQDYANPTFVEIAQSAA